MTYTISQLNELNKRIENASRDEYLGTEMDYLEFLISYNKDPEVIEKQLKEMVTTAIDSKEQPDIETSYETIYKLLYSDIKDDLALHINDKFRSIVLWRVDNNY